jgi:hypothetical protein
MDGLPDAGMPPEPAADITAGPTPEVPSALASRGRATGSLQALPKTSTRNSSTDRRMTSRLRVSADGAVRNMFKSLGDAEEVQTLGRKPSSAVFRTRHSL